MRLKARMIGTGLHPSEVIVEVKTSAGPVRLFVDRRSLEDGSLAIGAPLAQAKRRLLVELPRETMSGAWRIWVAEGEVIPDTVGKVA